MFHKTMSMTQKKRIAYGYSNRSEEPSRRTLSRQAAQKCVGKGMSRHRCLPRATLSTYTPLQSLRKDILRQHFAKFHYAHPEWPTLYIINAQLRNPKRLSTSSDTTHYIIVNVLPSHSARSTTTSWTTLRFIQHNPSRLHERRPCHPRITHHLSLITTVPAFRPAVITNAHHFVMNLIRFLSMFVQRSRRPEPILFPRLQLSGWHACVRKRYAA